MTAAQYDTLSAEGRRTLDELSGIMLRLLWLTHQQDASDPARTGPAGQAKAQTSGQSEHMMEVRQARQAREKNQAARPR